MEREGILSNPLAASSANELCWAEQAEETFLRGGFRESLADANRYLQRARGGRLQSSLGEEDENLSIASFTLWDRSCEMRVHWAPTEEDRMGSIALQSWYELWRQQPTKRPGYRQPVDKECQKHLLPFLMAFSGSDQSMSVDLAWIWLQLLWSIGERRVAFKLALHLWKKAVVRDDCPRTAVEEGFSILGTLFLPCSNFVGSDTFWRTWWTREDYAEGLLDTACSKLTGHPTKEAVHTLLRELPHMASQLRVSMDLSERLRKVLETLAVSSSSPEDQHDDAKSGTYLERNQPNVRSFFTTHRWDDLWKHVQQRLRHVVRQWVRMIPEDDENGTTQPQQRALVASLAIISAWGIWRRKGKIVGILKRLCQVMLLPVQELLEAALPVSQR
jgi:hypothetical protein